MKTEIRVIRNEYENGTPNWHLAAFKGDKLVRYSCTTHLSEPGKGEIERLRARWGDLF